MDGDSWGEYARELRHRDLAPSSRARYAQVVAAFRSWLGVRAPTAELARDYLAGLRERGYKPRSILLHYRVLRPFLASLGQELKIRVRKPRDLPPYYDAGDIERLIAQAERGLWCHTPAIRQENTALVLLMAFAGLRRGEALALTVADVDFERRLIRVRQGKGGVDRNIPMAERLVVPLRDVCGGKGRRSRLFTVSPGRCYRRIVHLARACGLEGFHPHSLRHAFATRLVENGANLKAVQQLLGHASLETTAIYLDVAPDHLRAAVTGMLSTYKLKGAVRDPGRALGLPPDQVDRLARGADHGSAANLSQKMGDHPDFRDKVDAPGWKHLVELASQLDGFPKYLAQHPGGMVIGSSRLTDLVPVQPGAIEERYILQWDKDSIDDAGFVKIDFLALGALSQMQEALDLIQRRTGHRPDLSRIDFEDKGVYDMLCRADTIGIFQVESVAQIQTITRIQPRNLVDMAHEVAAVRPGVGVNDGVTHYIRRHQGRVLSPGGRPAPLLGTACVESL